MRKPEGVLWGKRICDKKWLKKEDPKVSAAFGAEGGKTETND